MKITQKQQNPDPNAIDALVRTLLNIAHPERRVIIINDENGVSTQYTPAQMAKELRFRSYVGLSFYNRVEAFDQPQ